MHHKLLINVRYPQNQIYPLDLALGILTISVFQEMKKMLRTLCMLLRDEVACTFNCLGCKYITRYYIFIICVQWFQMYGLMS